MRLIAALIALFFIPARAPLQTPLPRNSEIRGRVIDAETGAPIARASVWAMNVTRRTVNHPNPRSGDDESKSDGSFAMRNMEPGEYILFVLIRINSFSIPPTIARADPSQSVVTERNAVVIDNGGRSFMEMSGPLRAKSGGGWTTSEVYTTTYFGGDSEVTAERVRLAPASTRDNVVIRLRASPSARVTGIAVDDSGRPAPNARVTFHRGLSLPNPDPFQELPHGIVASATTDEQGKFTFLAAPTGDFRIRAIDWQQKEFITVTPLGKLQHATSHDFSADPGLEARSPAVAITSSIANDLKVRVVDPWRLAPSPFRGVRISGTFTNTRPDPKADEASWISWGLFLQSADTRAESTRILYNGSSHFAFNGVPPGTYELSFWSVQGLCVASVTLDGKPLRDNVLEVGTSPIANIDVTFGERTNAVSGTVTEVDNSTTSNSWVVLIPVNDALWPLHSRERIQYVRTINGRYSFAEIPKGEYFIAAADDETMDDWPDVKAFRAISARAARVVLANGAVLTKNLVVARPSK